MTRDRRLCAWIAMMMAMGILIGCNKTDPDYELLTSKEVKVVMNGEGDDVECPFCQKSIGWERYHHHYCSKEEHCPIEGCEYDGQDHRHCYYNGEVQCPGHERGHGGMGGGSWM